MTAVDMEDIRDVPVFMSTPQHLIDQGFYRWPAGPEMWMVCSACDFNTHRCHFCGDELRHAETISGTNLHACYRGDK